MMTAKSLEKTLKNKHKLSFKENGEYKILFLSDIHYYAHGGDLRALEAVQKVVGDVMPDLVLWAGDGPCGAESKADLIRVMTMFSEPMESRGIPWAVAHGNHAPITCHGMSVKEVQNVFEKQFSYCVSKHVKGIHGYSNFVLPIYSSKDPDRIALNVFSLDSGCDMSDINEGSLIPNVNILEDVKFKNAYVRPTAHNFDIVRFDQLAWYWKVSEAVEKLNGKTPAIMFMHCPPHEAKLIQENPEKTEMTGEFDERIRTGPINSGLFATILQRGDVIGLYYGHNHNNTAEGKLCGIRMGYVGSIGTNGYGVKKVDTYAEINSLRGARVLTFREDDILNYSSEFLYAHNYVEYTEPIVAPEEE